MRLGLLSSYGHPQLPLFVKALIEHGVSEPAIICDTKQMSAKDIEIWNRRTEGSLDIAPSFATSMPPGTAKPLAYYVVPSHNDPACLSLLKSLEIDVLLNAGTPRKLSAAILEYPLHGVINIHPGVLPQYRGCSCVEHALLNGDTVGNTAHLMNEGYDTGPIIEVESYDITQGSSYSEIRTMVYRRGYDLAARILSKLQSQHPSPLSSHPQDEAQAVYWKPISNQDLQRIDERLKTT